MSLKIHEAIFSVAWWLIHIRFILLDLAAATSSRQLAHCTLLMRH